MQLAFFCLIGSWIHATIKLWHFKHDVRLFLAWLGNISTSTPLGCCDDIRCGSEIICTYGLEEDHPSLSQISVENHAKAYDGGSGWSEGPQEVLKIFWNFFVLFIQKRYPILSIYFCPRSYNIRWMGTEMNAWWIKKIWYSNIEWRKTERNVDSFRASKNLQFGHQFCPN